MLHVMIIMQEVSTSRCLYCVITDWRFVAPVVIVDQGFCRQGRRNAKLMILKQAEAMVLMLVCVIMLSHHADQSFPEL